MQTNFFTRSWPRVVCVALLLWVSLAVPAFAADPLRLVVILVVDQFRADYIDTYGQQWTQGLRRLIDDGARFTDCLLYTSPSPRD